MKHFDFIKPTFIENWPRELCSLSIAQVDIPLTMEETRELEKLTTRWWDDLEEGKPPPKTKFLESMLDRLRDAIDKFPRGAFVRLGSRSPKDTEFFANTKGRCVGEGACVAAMTHLLQFSERVLQDLWQAIENEYPVHIFVREWLEIPQHAEFRCFMRSRKLVGTSQYHHFSGHFPEIQENAESIRWAIEEFFRKFQHVFHLDDVVFDVFVRYQRTHPNSRTWEVKLLEINPFGEWTDPALFDWRNGGDFDGSFRYNRK